MGDKKIIANDLQAMPQGLGHGPHAFDVVLGKTILHRNDRVIVGPTRVQGQQLVAVKAPVFTAPVVHTLVVVLGGGQIQADRHIAAGLEPRRLDGLDQGFDGAFVGSELRPKPTLVGHAQVLALLGQGLARSVVDLGHPLQRLGETAGAIGDGQKILQIHTALGMRAAAKNLNLWQGQPHLIAARQIPPQRQIGLAAGRPHAGQRHGGGAVAPDARFVWRAIGAAQGRIKAHLIGDVHAHQCGGDDFVHRAHRPVHPQALEPRTSIAQLFGFTGPRGRTGWGDGTSGHTCDQPHLGLDGGAATRIPYRAGTNGLNLTHGDKAFKVMSKT